MIHKKYVKDKNGGEEVFVYWNGKLLYKMWFSDGIKRRSLLFDEYGPPISNKDRDDMRYRDGG